MKQNICVMGEGAWGTAIATLLAHNGYRVALWCHDKTVVDSIKTTHNNKRYLDGVSIAEHIHPTSDMHEALADVSVVFLATPVTFLRTVLEDAKISYRPHQTWIMLSKGIEHNTFMFPTQIVDDVFSARVTSVVLSGPSFARDLANQQATGVVLAAAEPADAQRVQAIVESSYLKTWYSADVVGVQAAAALKNVIALGIGMLEGSGAANNTKALFLTCGLQEMAQLIEACGGHKTTVYGLSGVGDLVLTSFGMQSRNFMLGRRIGAGETLAAIALEGGIVPEGVNTVGSLHHVAHKYQLMLPALQAVYRVLFEQESAAAIQEVLMD